MNLNFSAQQFEAYRFGRFTILPRRQCLIERNRQVKIGSKAFDLLQLLVSRAGEVVTKDEIMAHVWPEVFVDDGNLKVNISHLRRILGETMPHPRYIATIVGRGYRFVAPVEPLTSYIQPPEIVTGHAEPCLPPAHRVIGRLEEIGRVIESFEQGSVVTLTGPGGVGKTTLALEIASRSSDGDSLPGVFVDLATVSNGIIVFGFFARALGIQGSLVDPLAAACELLSTHPRLIVLDNCEHVLAAAALVAERVHAASPLSRILVTSREPLGLQSEIVHRIGALAYPPDTSVLTVDEALQYSAIELFGARAFDWAGYTIIEPDLPAIVALCQLADGLPMAIELVAAAAGEYAPAALLAMLDPALSRFPSRFPDVHVRHQTLQATMEWSYRLLSPEEAAIFRALALFAGPFEPDDVVAVCSDQAGPDVHRMIAGLGRLVAKSLVVPTLDGQTVRYRLLDSTRAFAIALLADDPKQREVHHRFAKRILTVFEQSEQDWNWHDASDWLARYRIRVGDLRKVLDWAFGPDGDSVLGIRLTAAAAAIFAELSAISEASAQVDRALSHARASGGRSGSTAKLLISKASSMIFLEGLPPELKDIWVEAADHAEREGDIESVLRALGGLAIFHVYAGEHQRAIEALHRFRHVATTHGEYSALPNGDRILALARAYRGELLLARAELERLARHHQKQSRRSQRSRFYVDAVVGVNYTLAPVLWITGQPDAAAAAAARAVEADAQPHLLSQANALMLAALPVSFWNGDEAALERYLSIVQSRTNVEVLTTVVPVQKFYSAGLDHMRGIASATDRMQEAIDDWLATGIVMRSAMYMSILAEAHLQRDDLNAAERVLQNAFARSRRSGEYWCQSELLRIEAGLLRAAGNRAAARQKLAMAVRSAESIGAQAFTLRAASDLAAMLLDEGQRAAARERLEPCFLRFTEGFGTRDLRRAQFLLQAATCDV